jgi:adenylate cyclase class IV
LKFCRRGIRDNDNQQVGEFLPTDSLDAPRVLLTVDEIPLHVADPEEVKRALRALGFKPRARGR